LAIFLSVLFSIPHSSGVGDILWNLRRTICDWGKGGVFQRSLSFALRVVCEEENRFKDNRSRVQSSEVKGSEIVGSPRKSEL